MTETPPHYARLRARIARLDAPLVVLWGWPGTGKRALLAALLAEPDCAALPAQEAADVQARRTLAQRAGRRFVLDEPVPAAMAAIAYALRPDQQVVASVTRLVGSLPPRAQLIGPRELLLEVGEARRLFSGNEGAASPDDAYALTEGWWRPLDILARGGRPEVMFERLELFVREVLGALGAEEVELLRSCARLSGALDDADLSALAASSGAFDRLVAELGLVARRGRELRVPELLRRQLRGEGLLPHAPAESPPAVRASETLRPRPRPRAAHDGFAVQLLGVPGIERLGDERRALRVPLRRALLLLGLLASRPGLAAGRDEVVLALWPDDDEEVVERNLHPTVSWLRRALLGRRGRSPVLFEGGVYRLNPDFEWRIDVVEFERDALLGRPLEPRQKGHPLAHPDWTAWENAWKRYRGPFMQGFEQAWIETKRAELHRLYLELLRGLGRSYLDLGRLAQAEDALRSALLADPLQEGLHVSLMEIYAQRGRRDLVRRQYERLCRVLQDELGVEPMAGTAAQYHRFMTLAETAEI